MTTAPLQVFEPAVESALREKNDSSAWFDRRSLVEQLRRTGLPRSRSERWKYQNPQPLIESLISDHSKVCELDSSNATLEPFSSLDRSDLERLAIDLTQTFTKSPLLMLNGLLCSQGYRLKVDSKKTSNLKIFGEFDSTEVLYLELTPQSSLEIEDCSSGGNLVIVCKTYEDSSLRLIRLQPSTNSSEFRYVCVVQEGRSDFTYRMYGEGSSFRSNEIVVESNSEGSSTDLIGVWRTKAAEQVNHHFTVNHNVPDCRSSQSYRSIINDRSRSVLNGRIYIHPQARKSEAHLINKNISLGQDAEAYAKPELAIFNDDVVCSHGVTTGQLDPDATFYLQSRGLPPAKAKSVLTSAFLRELAPDEVGREFLGL